MREHWVNADSQDLLLVCRHCSQGFPCCLRFAPAGSLFAWRPPGTAKHADDLFRPLCSLFGMLHKNECTIGAFGSLLAGASSILWMIRAQ
jgi:hypothetical protein